MAANRLRHSLVGRVRSEGYSDREEIMPNVNLSKPLPAYDRMRKSWDLIHDLRGGTIAMRDAKTKWLPQEPKESDDQYSVRLNRSVLYEGYADTVDKLASKPFSKQLVVEIENKDGSDAGVVPAESLLGKLMSSADRAGTTLHEFAHAQYADMIDYGKYHILVDYPKVNPNADGSQRTLAQDVREDIRPYFVSIAPLDLFWWSWTRVAGAKILNKIRYWQTREVVNQDGEIEEVKDIIEYGRREIARFEEEEDPVSKEKMWVEKERRPNTLGKIPLVTRYTRKRKKAELESAPALEGLAWLNLAHWQSMSDQRNCLRFARVSLIFMSGVTDAEKESPVVVGPNRIVRSTNENAKAYHVEHSGAAISAGENDLIRLEERMQVLGMQPLVENTGNTTAAGRTMDEAKSHSKAQEWAFLHQDGIREAIELAYEWAQKPVPNYTVILYTDFGVTLQAGQEAQSLYTAARDKLLSNKTFLNEYKRRGIVSIDLNLETEMQQIALERREAAELAVSNAAALAAVQQPKGPDGKSGQASQ